MAYITREDGEHFVIPSYRDVLSAKKTNLLKREIMLLSSNYGEYITLQKKNADQYEVAFSTETGYLLGETIWNHFKRPINLIYCEAIPNTTEVILVIVKSGSVYLDGSFPIDSIAEELVIFKTQQINFDIYVYGDVPISRTPEPGKFTFDASSVKSFNILPTPAFPKVNVVKNFQLQRVDAVLESKGIGVFPIKNVIYGLVAIGLIFMAYIFITTHKKDLPKTIISAVNPYQTYVNTLTSPAPSDEIFKLTRKISLLLTVPGWSLVSVNYSNGKVVAEEKSEGSRTNVLFDWAKKHDATVDILPTGFFITTTFPQLNRLPPTEIHSLKAVLGNLIDRLSYVLQGNNLTLLPAANRGEYSEVNLALNLNGISLNTLNLVGKQFQSLPLTMSKLTLTFDNGYLSGTINLKALGN
jgi:hypothetical protein